MLTQVISEVTPHAIGDEPPNPRRAEPTFRFG